MWSWLYLQLLNLVVFIYLFIYYLYQTSAVLYSYLCGLFIGLCASAMFNSHFSLVIGVFDKPKKVIKSRDFVRVIRTINNIISINLSFHLISVCLLPQSGIHTVKLRHKPYTNTRIWQHLKPYSKGMWSYTFQEFQTRQMLRIWG